MPSVAKTEGAEAKKKKKKKEKRVLLAHSINTLVHSHVPSASSNNYLSKRVAGVRDAGVGGVSMRRQGYRSNLGQTGSGFHSPAAPAPLHPATPPPRRRSPWLCHECVSCTVHSSGLSYDWNEDMSAHSLYRLAFTFSAWILQQDSSGLFNCPELLLRLNEGRKWKGK